MKKIILTNLLVLLFLFGILEFVSYLYIRHDAKKFFEDTKQMAIKRNMPLPTQKYAPVKLFNQEQMEDFFRPTNFSKNKNNEKKPLLFFGCSYMAGVFLDNKETLPAIINEKTDRTTINRGIPGGCILNALYDLRNEKFYEKITKEPEYIIYILINDHFSRIANPYTGTIAYQDNPYYILNLQYKLKNSVLVADNPNKFLLPFYGLYTVKAWHYLFAEKIANVNRFDKLVMLLGEAKKITDEKFPNSKFVIIDYQDGGHRRMLPEVKDKLEAKGFIIFDAEELAGHELNSEQWRGDDKEHPNGAAFHDVAMGLIKELNL